MRSSTFIVLVSIAVLAFPLFFLSDTEGSQIEGRTDISFGLPQDGFSFTTVESFDSDGNGKDEIYLGGAGFTDNALTEGILAYEYDIASGQWNEFGSGLPGDGSGNYYGALGLGDINGDGEMDIAAPLPTRWYLAMDETNSGVDIYTGDGQGSFDFLNRILLTDPLGARFHDSSNEVEIIDLDNDGHNDIAISTYVGIRVFFGDSSGTNWEESSPPHLKQTEISGVGIGDLNNDGLLDLVGTPYQRSTDVEMYIQGSRRSWRDVPFEETSAGYGVKILDLDLDGNNDVIFGTNGEGIRAFLGEGEVSLTEFPHTEASSGLPSSDGPWNQLELRDINGDDYPDLVAACSSRETVNVYLNELPSGWTEVFTGSDEMVVGGDPYGTNFGDWDGDGQIDVAGCGWDDGANAWLINGGEGSSGGNLLPIASAGDDMTVNIGDVVTLDGSDSEDPDGEIVEWEWKCTSHPSLSMEDADTDSPSFTAEEEGTYVFTLRVKDDNDEWSGISSVRVTVLDPDVNYPPSAVISGDSAGVVGETVNLDGSGSIDVDGDVVGWQWSCTSHTISFQGSTSSQASFVPDEVGEYEIELVVEDDSGEFSDPDSITIHVESGISYVYPLIGPITYTSGDPVVGAKVTIQGNGETYSKETDQTGKARFTQGVLPGTYDVTVEIEGEKKAEFSIEVKDDGDVVPDTGSYPQILSNEAGTGEGNSLVLIAAVVGIIIIALVFLFFIVRGMGGKREQVEVAQTFAPKCPKCGSTARWIPDFQRNYCDSCSEYL